LVGETVRERGDLHALVVDAGIWSFVGTSQPSDVFERRRQQLKAVPISSLLMERLSPQRP
jgi:hypothetical protein